MEDLRDYYLPVCDTHGCFLIQAPGYTLSFLCLECGKEQDELIDIIKKELGDEEI